MSFLDDLRNFETAFAQNLTSTDENFVKPFYAEVSEEFVGKLAGLDWEAYRGVDLEESLVDVDSEGVTRIVIAHCHMSQERESKWFRRGIEIIIADEITIDFFAVFQTCFAVVGVPTYFHLIEGGTTEREDEDEPKWEYSEIDEAIQKLSDNFENGTRIKRISWREEIISQGIWEHDTQEYWMVPLFQPRLRLKMAFAREEPREEILSLDWKSSEMTRT